MTYSLPPRPLEEPWSPKGKSAQELRDHPEEIRAWEDRERALDHELEREWQEDKAAQSRFNDRFQLITRMILFAAIALILVWRFR